MYKSHIKQESKRILKLLNYDVTLENLLATLQNDNREIYFYNNSNTIGDKIIDAIHEKEYAQTVKSFSYEKDSQQFIFVKSNLDYNEKRFLILHELGHLLLGHNRHKVSYYETNLQCENEANSFANAVLNHRYNRQSKTIALFAGIILVGMACFAYLGLNQTIEIKEDNSECFITATGDKYHIKCDYLKDNKGVTWITIKEAKNRKLAPCKKCFPEEYKNSDV